MSGIVPEQQSSGGGTQYTDGAAAPANPVGTMPVFDNGGVITAVSDVNPLPVDATVSIPAGLATEAVQTDGTQKTQIVDAGGDAVTVTGGKLDVNASIDTTGLATSAKQDSQTALLTTIDADTSALAAAADTVDSAITGSHPVIDARAILFAQRPNTSYANIEATAGGNLKVAVEEFDSALPAGTNNIGDVDVASIAAGTNYIGKTRLTDGTTDAEVVPLAGYNAQAVAIVDSSGNQISSFGGGTQYTDGAAEAAPTGTVAMGTDGSNVFAVHTDTSGDLQVDVLTLPAIPAGNNNIGDVDIASIAAGDNNIGNVDVVTLPSIPAGNNNIGDVDVASIAAGTNYIGKVRLTDGTTDSDIRDLANSNALNVAIVNGSGDQITSFGGGTQYADGAAEASPTGTVAMGTDGANVFALHTDTSGDLQVDVLTMPTTTVQATNLDIRDLVFASDKVDASGTVLGAGTNNIGDVDVLTLPSLPAGTNNIGDVDVLTVPADPFGVNADAASSSGSISAKLRQIATNGHPITGSGLTVGAVDETGASAVDALAVGGGTPHDSVDSGNPQKIGGKAVAFGATPTEVAAADRTDFYAIRAGIPFVLGGHMNAVTLEYATTGAQTDTAIITQGAGGKICVTQIQIVTDNANTAFPQIRVGFGTANTPTTTGVVATHPGLPAGGGISRGDGSGIIGVGADNEDLRITCGAPTGGSIRVLVTYFITSS